MGEKPAVMFQSSKGVEQVIRETKMKKIAAIAALSASTLGLSTGMSFADYTLNILHINDWHSRIESNNKYESTCSAEEETKGECTGGAARLITAIAQQRKKLDGQNVLLLSAGDNFQGSLFYTTYKGKTEGEFLNQMKFDALAVGNHEFDDGEAALAPFLDMIKFPVLGANVKANAQSKLGDRVKPSVVIEVGGQKIGVVGAVTNDTPELASPGPNVTIEDDVKLITSEVERLKGEGVNKIIAVTHIGYKRERDVIAKIPGVDVVVGGHSHSLLSNTDPKAEGPYPTMVDNPDGYKVPVVQAASYSKYLGEFKVVFDDNGVVKQASGDPIYLDKSITPDPAVLARIKELGAPIEALKNKEVAETTKAIDGSRENCRTRECEMGNLVSDAVLDRVKDQGVEIVITNGGGLRASIDQGTVTMGEVLNVLPFQNTVATFQQGSGWRAGERSQPDRGRRRTLPTGCRPEIFIRQIGRRECRARQIGRSHARRRVDADQSGQGLPGRDQQLCAPGRRRLQGVRRQGQKRLRLRSGPRAGGRRLPRRASALYAEARGPHHRNHSRRRGGTGPAISPAIGPGTGEAGRGSRSGRARKTGRNGSSRDCGAGDARTAGRFGRYCHDTASRADGTRPGSAGTSGGCACRAGKAGRKQPCDRCRRHLLGFGGKGLWRWRQVENDLRRQQGLRAAPPSRRRNLDHPGRKLNSSVIVGKPVRQTGRVFLLSPPKLR